MKPKSFLFRSILMLYAPVLIIFLACSKPADEKTTSSKDKRMEELINFFSCTVHAGQVAICLEGNREYDKSLFDPGGFNREELKNMAALADSMVSLGPEKLKTWVELGAPNQNLARLLGLAANAPRPAAEALPCNVLENYLTELFGDRDRNSILALANTIQLITQVDRDADLVQDMISLYLGLGLKVSLTLLGIDGNNLDTLLVIAEKLAPATGKTPFDMEVIDWQLYLHKLEMWEAKISGRRDKKIIAAELIKSDPVVISMIEALKMLPAKKVAFLGHSLTMSVHWSTYGSWCDIAGEITGALNKNFNYADFNSGGLTPTKTLRRGHLDDLAAYGPTETYVLMRVADNQEEIAAFDSIVAVIKNLGSKCYLVDGVRPWAFSDAASLKSYRERMRAYCLGKNIELLEFCDLWEKERADISDWRPLKQDIHMCTPGHVFYARELLKFWLAQSRRN